MIRKKNINKFKNTLAIKKFPIIIILCLLTLISGFYVVYNTYKEFFVVEIDGYMISNSSIDELKDEENKKNENIEIVKVKNQDTIYKNSFNHYVDDKKKTSVNVYYPLYVNNGLTIINYNENINLIDKNFNRITGYKDLIISYGKIYDNTDFSQLDQESYILLQYENGIFINLYDIEVKTITQTITIPTNSFLFLFEDKINYYERTSEGFQKKVIQGVDLDSKIKFYYEGQNEIYEYTYEQLITGTESVYIHEEPPVIEEIVIPEEIEVEYIPPVVEPSPPVEREWEKPSVKVEDFTGNVYSIESKITIKDPAGVITTAPTFTLYENNKVVTRRMFYGSGKIKITGLSSETEYSIVGQYTYLAEDKESKRVVTFYKGTVQTKDRSSLETIDLEFEKGDIFSQKVVFNNVKIISSLDSEAIYGIKNFAIKLNGESYTISKNKLVELLNGNSIKIETKDVLPSNSNIDFEFLALDKDKNELNLSNNKGSTRTSKKEPTAFIKETDNEIVTIKVKVDTRNEDKVDLNNYRYIVQDLSGSTIISSKIESENITISNLDPNRVYYVRVLADIDLNDNKGIRKGYQLGELEISTIPISSLGFVNLKLETKNIGSDELTISTNINKNKTHKILLQVIDSITLNVYDIETEEKVFTYKIKGSALANMKNAIEFSIRITGLDSNTKYKIEYKSRALQGKTEYISECITNLYEVETRKKPAQVLVTNKFVTQNMIDFDIRVIDEDHSVLSDEVTVELRNAKNDIQEHKVVKTNQEEGERITFNYLTALQNYYIYVYANEYNETKLNSEYKTKYELLKLSEYTQEGIYGSIELVSSVRKPTGTNILDINSEYKWIESFHYYNIPKDVDSNGHMHIYSKNGVSAYAYDLEDYYGKLVTVSFKIKAITPLNNRFKLYFNNYISGTTNASYGTELKNIPTNQWKSFSFTYVVGSYKDSANNRFIPVTSLTYGKNNASYAGFYFTGGDATLAEYEVAEMQVEVHEEEKIAENIQIESGYYANNGKKYNSTTQTRTAEDILLEGGYYYQFNYTSKYASLKFYDPVSNALLRNEGFEVSGKTYYIPTDRVVRVTFRREIAVENMSPGEVQFSINKIKEKAGDEYNPYEYILESQVKVNLTDLRDEITNDDYFIKVYENNKEIKQYNYIELEGKIKIENEIKKIDLEENKNYKIELGIKIRDRYYPISSFDIETKDEVKSINDLNDWFYIQPKGNYILLTDLKFYSYREQRTGFGYRYFYGTIDFQGYKISTYAEYSSSVRRFDRIEKSAVLKNLVLDVHYNNYFNINYWTSFVNSNYGTISNVHINIINEQEEVFPNSGLAPLAYVNQISGKIENFTVNVVNQHNLYQNSTLFVAYNYGTIQNGYTYGEDLIAEPVHTSTSPNIGLIQMQGGSKSLLKNVYSINNVIFPTGSQLRLGLICRYTAGTIKNVISTGSSNYNLLSAGPAVIDIGNTANMKNVYYLSDYVYTNKYQQRINETALNDVAFQKSVLGDGFEVDSMIKMGYYPQVKYTSEKMPKQPFILLPEPLEDNLVDIISLEKIEGTDSEAIVEFNVKNPQGEEITEIIISDLSVEILEQSYDDGKSIVKARLYDPVLYLSKYSIKSISSKNYLGYKNQRNYIIGEKYAEIEFFIQIETIEDWIKINKGLNQNYKLLNDLNFQYSANYRINNFSGKLEGNNHTIKNIHIEQSGVTGLFNQMNGILQNLYVENYSIKGTSSYAGLVGYSNSNGRYYNVHMKNVEIEASSKKTSDVFMAGAIVGHGSSSRIQDCSATNVKVTSNLRIRDVGLGGLVGYGDAMQINNSFAQNVDISSTQSITTYGAGGLAGRINSGDAYVSECYVTGKVFSDNNYTGGLIGLTAAYVERNISSVDVESRLNYTGGLIGYTTTDVARYVQNLYLGNIYTIKNANKIFGNASSNELNYSLSSSLINGRKFEETNKETSLDYSSLLDENTFINIIELGNSYDYSQVKDGYLPKLYYLDSTELMPNQLDNPIHEQEKLEIDGVNINKHAEYANVTIYVKNPDNFEITGATVDGAEVVVERITTDEEKGLTAIITKIYPEKYYDIYKINGIKYKETEEDEEKIVPKSYRMDIRFYKYIRNLSDWNKIDSDTPENYIITSNLDFTNRTDFKTGVIVNRLETTSKTEYFTIKGATINIVQNKNAISLIEKVVEGISNIIFEDITIKDTSTGANNYIGIILYSYGTVENIKFKNIEINAPNEHYVAPISLHYGPSVNNIELDNVKIRGYNYTAGLIAHGINNEKNTYKNISAQKLDILTTKGNYIGGIFGNLTTSHSDKALVENIHITKSSDSIKGTESKIVASGTGSTYVGGIAGLGECTNCSVDGIYVYGAVQVGGMFGQQRAYYSENNKVTNSIIEGSKNYIGGIAGYVRYLYDSYVENTEIRSTQESTYGVGGIAGNQAAWEIRACGVSNVNITGLGTEHGGIVGRKDGGNVYSTYVQDSIINGASKVGGGAGNMRGGWILLSNITRNIITSEGYYAGGIAGYMENTETGNAAIRENLVTAVEVKARSHAGGIIGGAQYPIYYNSNIYSLYFDGNIVSDDSNVGIGSGDNVNSEISTSYRSAFYENTKTNNEKLKNITSIATTGNNIIENIPLKHNYYLNAGKETSSTSYPNAAYTTEYIFLEQGKTYEMNIDYNNGNDWIRVMIYNTRINPETEDLTYIRTLTEGTNDNYISTNNPYAPKFIFTVKRDVNIKISFYNMQHINSYSLKEVSLGKSQLRPNQLLSYNDLKNKMTWTRYPQTTAMDYYYYSPLNFSYTYYDYEPLDYHMTSTIITDKTENSIQATLTANSITKDGVLFDGIDDKMIIDPEFTIGKEITVSTLINDPTSNDLPYQFYFTNEDQNTASNGFGIFLHYRTVYVRINKYNYSFGISIPRYVPVEITVTYDGKIASLYINGQFKKTVTINRTINSINGINTMISPDFKDGSYIRRFDGIISYLKVFDRALTDQEIKNNYQARSITSTDGLILYYDFKELENTSENGYYPTLYDYGIDVVPKNQIKTPLPVETEEQLITNSDSSSIRLVEDKISNIYDIYPSGTNTVNIEFDNIYDDVTFSYKNGNYISDSIKLTQKTYSLSYDYENDLELIINTRASKETITYTKEELKRTISIVNDKYYHIENNDLYENDKVIQKDIKHLYKNYALTKDNKLYNISTKEITESYNKQGVLETTTPLYSSIVNDQYINTYYNYSEILSDKQLVEREGQVLYKDNQLYLFKNNSNTKQDMNVFNNYNESTYQISLTKQSIVSLQNNIKVPSNFNNDKIIEISQDIDDNKPVIIIRYENGYVYVLDYNEGKELFTYGEEQQVTLFKYIFGNFSKDANLSSNKTYKSSKKLIKNIEKLNDQEIKNQLNSSNNTKQEETETTDEEIVIEVENAEVINGKENKVSNGYIQVYNYDTGEYEVYSTDDILNTEDEKIESENTTINNNPFLYNYFYGNKLFELTTTKTIIYISIFILIVINLGLLVRFISNKEVRNHE